jgi:hypothetical protein
MIFRSFIGVLKNIFSKRKDFSLFEQPLISGKGQGPLRGFSGAPEGISPVLLQQRPWKYPIRTLSRPFFKTRGIFKKAGFIF